MADDADALECSLDPAAFPPLPLSAPSALSFRAAYLDPRREHYLAVLPFTAHVPLLPSALLARQAADLPANARAALATALDLLALTRPRDSLADASLATGWRKAALQLQGECLRANRLALALFLQRTVLRHTLDPPELAACQHAVLSKVLRPWLTFPDPDLEHAYLEAARLPGGPRFWSLNLLAAAAPLLLAVRRWPTAAGARTELARVLVERVAYAGVLAINRAFWRPVLALWIGLLAVEAHAACRGLGRGGYLLAFALSLLTLGRQWQGRTAYVHSLLHCGTER